MDRRRFVTRLGTLTAIAGANGAIGLALNGCAGGGSRSKDIDELTEKPEGLASELAHLADPHFDQYVIENNGDDLYQTLLYKGVVSDTGELFQDSVAAAAPLDALVEYKGFYYTETELELYGLAYVSALS